MRIDEDLIKHSTDILL